MAVESINSINQNDMLISILTNCNIICFNKNMLTQEKAKVLNNFFDHILFTGNMSKIFILDLDI